jgi:uncharacterized protein (DUF433 family)
MLRKPVLRGTRITVVFVVDLLAQGWSKDDVLKNYPGVSHEDIVACLKYVSEILMAGKEYPLAKIGFAALFTPNCLTLPGP